METKFCIKCQRELPIDNFPFKKNKIRQRNVKNGTCKECRRKWFIERRKNDYERVKEIESKSRLKRREEEKIRSKKNRRRQYLYKVKRLKTDPVYKLKNNLSSQVRGAFTKKGVCKSKKSMELLGCDIETAKKHIESLFTEGMTWENHGLYGWHIDHIIPIDFFDLTNEEEQKKCFNYKNLQPLWADDNIHKSNKLDWKKEN